MSKQPPTNNIDQFDSDLQAIENTMNSMMQGAFSMMFKQLVDSTGIFETSQEFPGVNNNNTTLTTIFDGRNINNNNAATAVDMEDEFGGNDFKRLAKKHKQNRGVETAASTPDNSGEIVISPMQQQSNDINSATTTAGSIFNLLFHHAPEVFNREVMPNAPSSSISTPQQQQQTSLPNNSDEGGWSFTSTSQRTVYQPDGTQETIITKKKNGVTETIRQIRYADGRTEESREQKNSFWNRMFGRN